LTAYALNYYYFLMSCKKKEHTSLFVVLYTYNNNSGNADFSGLLITVNRFNA